MKRAMTIEMPYGSVEIATYDDDQFPSFSVDIPYLYDHAYDDEARSIHDQLHDVGIWFMKVWRKETDV